MATVCLSGGLTEKIRAWGGDAVRTVQTEHDVTFGFTLLETNEATAKAVFGDDNVTVTPAGPTAGTKLDITITSDALPEKLWVFDMKDGDKRRRLVLPNAQITATEDITYVHSDIIRYGVTITAYADEDGNCAYEYIDATPAGS